MIRNNGELRRLTISLIVALAIHLVLFIFVKKDALRSQILGLMHDERSTPLKIDRIEIIKPKDVERFRKVGIKDGAKDLLRPDLPRPLPTPPPGVPGKKGTAGLSLEKLGPQLPKTVPPPQANQKNNTSADFQSLGREKAATANSKSSHFYFNPKVEKVIKSSPEQEVLKSEATKGFGQTNKAMDNISNFEIRYERPEGVSEDELNSDEKAYYSFYVRSYKNYFSKIYSNYERIVVERPNLASIFDQKHLLIGKIDYDEKGNIVTVKILKSSANDDLHYFFEETLKQMNQPNPPKVFTKNQKQFSIYYQLKIN